LKADDEAWPLVAKQEEEEERWMSQITKRRQRHVACLASAFNGKMALAL
jgi:hypothetical protein